MDKKVHLSVIIIAIALVAVVMLTIPQAETKCQDIKCSTNEECQTNDLCRNASKKFTIFCDGGFCNQKLYNKLSTKSPNLSVNIEWDTLTQTTPPGFVCSDDSDCNAQSWNCFKCPFGTKLVTQEGCEKHYVLEGGDDKGVCSISYPAYAAFIYDDCRSRSAFCIVESEGYPVFTRDVSNVKYFDLWKQAILDATPITKDYFDGHFANFMLSPIIATTGASSIDISYIFYLDWVELRLEDTITLLGHIPGEPQPVTGYVLTDQEILEELRTYFAKTRKLKQIDSIIPFEEALEIMKNRCHPNAESSSELNNFYEQEYLSMDENGDLILRGSAFGEDIESDGKEIEVNLITGELKSCEDIYIQY
jgi:hypothetical protein